MVKQGANTKFIATYLFNNPGALGAEVRRELCKARGIDPGWAKRGWYTCYFYGSTSIGSIDSIIIDSCIIRC